MEKKENSIIRKKITGVYRMPAESVVKVYYYGVEGVDGAAHINFFSTDNFYNDITHATRDLFHLCICGNLVFLERKDPS